MKVLSEMPGTLAVALNGTEHTHPSFVQELRTNDLPAAKFVRFAPDGVMVNKKGNVIHWDAKCAATIERDAYETYLKYGEAGCTVLLFVKHEGHIYWQRIENLRFLSSEEIVLGFPPGRRFPVENGWICPRKKPGYREQVSRNMSGTPYQMIDFSSMKLWTRAH